MVNILNSLGLWMYFCWLFFSIFFFFFGYVSESVCDESLSPEVEYARSCQTGSESVTKRDRQKREIYRLRSHVTGSKDLFLRGTNFFGVQHADVIEDTGTWLQCPHRFPKLLGLFWRLANFVLGTSEFWIQNFLSMCSLFKIIGV